MPNVPSSMDGMTATVILIIYEVFFVLTLKVVLKLLLPGLVSIAIDNKMLLITVKTELSQ